MPRYPHVSQVYAWDFCLPQPCWNSAAADLHGALVQCYKAVFELHAVVSLGLADALSCMELVFDESGVLAACMVLAFHDSIGW